MTADRVSAAFDLALDPRQRDGQRLRGAFCVPPSRVIATSVLAEVPAAVAAAEDAAAAGSWVVGGLAYEAGGAWDAAQHTHPGTGELARFEVYDTEPVEWPSWTGPAAVDWFPSGSFSAPGPAAAVVAVQQHIAAGDCYQVNLTSRMRACAEGDLFARFAALASAQPLGYAVYLAGAGVASVSPELFFHSHPDGRLVTQPMKGTAPASVFAEALLASPKERAENLMIVDLLRNDLGRVCAPGTVSVDALFELLRLPTVVQLVSTVSGRRRPGTTLADIFGALFPCGSVTGAPKIRAMEVIRELESQPRGWYCGALGVIRPGGEAVFNVPIRTVEQHGDWLECGVGSGVVADSRPAAEVAEWRAKTRFLGGEPIAALETLLLADGVFPHLERHLDRLSRTDAALGLGIDLEHVEDRLSEQAVEFRTGRHRVRVSARDGSLRLKLSPAPGTELPVRLAVAAEALDVAALRPVIAHKTTWRGHYDRLRELAPAEVFDVICHTPDGLVTEATLGNLAFEIDGRWVTPPASVGLLPGVERAHWLAAGRIVEAEVHLSDLPRATSIAFLNGLRGWCPAVLTPRQPT